MDKASYVLYNKDQVPCLLSCQDFFNPGKVEREIHRSFFSYARGN